MPAGCEFVASRHFILKAGIKSGYVSKELLQVFGINVFQRFDFFNAMFQGLFAEPGSLKLHFVGIAVINCTH